MKFLFLSALFLSLFPFIAILAFIIWLAALIDVLRNEFTGSNKLIWFLAVTFLPFIGPVLYVFIGTKQKIRSTDPSKGELYISSKSESGSEDKAEVKTPVESQSKSEKESITKFGPPFNTKEEYEKWKAERMQQNEDKEKS